MQFKTVIIAALASVAAAQDLSELPTCAQPCFTDNFDLSGCDSTDDYACLCASSDYNNAVTLCVVDACDSDDQIAAITWATATCDAVGVPISL
ncbi:hypothetical protein GQ53DRAFT_827607 [Thozetella sp. PMI_491]|nr:hypothetical protein GQ53DRAFT_827607 [Thozetella sp. PMI_491]